MVVTCLRVLSVSWLCPPWRPGGVSAVVITGAVVLPAVASAPGVLVRTCSTVAGVRLGLLPWWCAIARMVARRRVCVGGWVLLSALSALSATVVDIVGAAPMVGEGWFDRRTAEIAADRG